MNTYESQFGKTEAGILRGGAMSDTYDANFYLNENDKIVGLKSDKINSGELFGESTDTKIETLGVGNIVKSIIENENYENIDSFIKEVNIAYINRLNKVLSYEESKEAA